MAEKVRLISLDYALGQLETGEREYGENFATDSSHVRDFLKALPIVEAAPVRRGRWLLEREPDGKPYCLHCSVCDDDFSNPGIMQGYDYCPNCGAKMDAPEKV